MDEFKPTALTAESRKPWKLEANYANWIDSDTGYNCIIFREEHDALCAFVCIERPHPFYGRNTKGKSGKNTPIAKDESAALASFRAIEVHGGISYCEPFLYHTNTTSVVSISSWWIGFNCSHSSDYVPSYLEIIDLVPPDDDLTATDIEELRQSILNNDTPESAYRTFSYVEEQCRLLAKQLKANEQPF